jgi:hypothetical protein
MSADREPQQGSILLFIPKASLSLQQAQYLAARLVAREHLNAQGAARAWGSRESGLAAVVFDDHPGKPFGIVAWSGPLNATSVAWWLDCDYRNRRLGYRLVDAFAEYLRSTVGVTGVISMPIVPDEGSNGAHEAANKVAARLANRPGGPCSDSMPSCQPPDAGLELAPELRSRYDLDVPIIDRPKLLPLAVAGVLVVVAGSPEQPSAFQFLPQDYGHPLTPEPSGPIPTHVAAMGSGTTTSLGVSSLGSWLWAATTEYPQQPPPQIFTPLAGRRLHLA